VENFARSQYEPNNINHLIGRDSLFVYDFSFSVMNRKGHMSERQKNKKLALESELGRFDVQSIRWATTRLILRNIHRIAGHAALNIVSDNHYLYRQSLERDLKCYSGKITHTIVPASEPRTFKNLLFPINHMDNLLRHYVKAFTRETIAFSKRHWAMLDKYILFSMIKNYCKPVFSKKHKNNPTCNVQTPAQIAGVATKAIQRGDLFRFRPFKLGVTLVDDWICYYHGVDADQRLPIAS
jgi:hypothetical protein